MLPVSVVIPTFRRHIQLGVALRKILDCDPSPSEIIVHVDAGDSDTGPWIRETFPGVRILHSEDRVGPGGGRNKLVAAARHDIVASFDDDSYPLDKDYFARLSDVFIQRPDAAVIASQITHRGELVPDSEAAICSSAHFVGCGVAYRRGDFIESEGYVPLAVAYGMEEVDFCIRLMSRGKKVYFTPWLRVFHDTDRSHHASASITAATIANQALLVYLRYPLRYWPYGALQITNRLVWLVKAGRYRGLVSGLLKIPAHLWRYREYRAPVTARAFLEFLQARRSSPRLEPLPLQSQ